MKKIKILAVSTFALAGVVLNSCSKSDDEKQQKQQVMLGSYLGNINVRLKTSTPLTDAKWSVDATAFADTLCITTDTLNVKIDGQPVKLALRFMAYNFTTLNNQLEYTIAVQSIRTTAGNVVFTSGTGYYGLTDKAMGITAMGNLGDTFSPMSTQCSITLSGAKQ